VTALVQLAFVQINTFKLDKLTNFSVIFLGFISYGNYINISALCFKPSSNLELDNNLYTSPFLFTCTVPFNLLKKLIDDYALDPVIEVTHVKNPAVFSAILCSFRVFIVMLGNFASQ
jgi:hypothetical protein